MSSPLTPARITPDTRVTKLTRADILGQLVIEAENHFFGRHTYYFLRANGKSVRDIRSDRSLPRESAMIQFKDNATTFTLIYWPVEGGEQVAKDLPLDELANAVNDLVAAGFKHRKIVPKLEMPSSQTNSAPIAQLE